MLARVYCVMSFVTVNVSVRSRSLGVHTPLWNHFPVEMGHLLQKPYVLQKLRTARPGSHYVLVVCDGAPRVGGEFALRIVKRLIAGWAAVPRSIERAT